MALTTAEPGEAAAPLPRAPAHALDLDARHRLAFDAKSHRDFENSFVSERKYSYPEGPSQDTKFSLEAAKPAAELAAELKRSEAAAKAALERYEVGGGGVGGGGGVPGVVAGGGAGTGALTAASCPSHTIDAILGLRSPLKGSPSPPHLHGLNNNTSTNNMNMAAAASPARGGGGGGRVGGGREDGGDTDDSSTATPPGGSFTTLFLPSLTLTLTFTLTVILMLTFTRPHVLLFSSSLSSINTTTYRRRQTLAMQRWQVTLGLLITNYCHRNIGSTTPPFVQQPVWVPQRRGLETLYKAV